MNAIEQESYEFYHNHSGKYAELVNEFFGDVYTDISHKNFKDDNDILKHIKMIIPEGAKVLDAGCGAGAREVHYYTEAGFDAYGVDVVEKNIETAKNLHPELSDKLSVANLGEPLDYPDEAFDFVSCNVVIQHILPEKVLNTTLPEFCRILKPNGVLQLMIKVGDGVSTIHDSAYDVDRTFYLHQPDELISVLEKEGMSLIDEPDDHLGGVIYFTDPKPMPHGAFWVRKQA